MTPIPLFPEPPRPAPPPREEKPKPAPYVPDTEAMKRREERILRILRAGPGTLADILRRSEIDGVALLSQSATLCSLTFMTRDGLVARSNDPEPVYSLPEK